LIRFIFDIIKCDFTWRLIRCYVPEIDFLLLFYCVVKTADFRNSSNGLMQNQPASAEFNERELAEVLNEEGSFSRIQ
jgi:hypothetical protein